MPKSSQSKTKPVQEMLPTSEKLDLIDNWLQRMLDAFPAKGQLSVQEIGDWHKDLLPFSAGAIEYSFEAHRRCGMFFPQFGQILDLCISYDGQTVPRSTHKCDSECKSQHWKSYQWNDWFWMMRKLRIPALMGPVNCRKDPVRPGEVEALLTECDGKRPGGPPEWKR